MPIEIIVHYSVLCSLVEFRFMPSLDQGRLGKDEGNKRSFCMSRYFAHVVQFLISSSKFLWRFSWCNGYRRRK